MKTNIILTGVGGQGVITAANILGKAVLNAGLNVYVSEIHGMAQRGGSVNCSVRIGDVYGPIVAEGTADAIISTEPIEALRYIKYSNNKTKIITDINPVIPFTVSVGNDKYPNLEKVFSELRKYGKLYIIDANKIAKEAGNIITKNIVLLGALAATDILKFKSDILIKTILENVPSKFKEINKKAFQEGFKAIKNE
jgi:indolepyruvate ferredoxin oxidoreductase beta subunit